MNNSISAWANRAIRRADKKERRKTKRRIMVMLLGKQKTDVRTEKNLEQLFGFILIRQRFTVPEVLRNTDMKSSVAYDLIEALSDRHLIKKVDEKRSPGRGKTDIFELTVIGKTAAAYMGERTDYLVKALNSLMEKEKNPVLRFSLEAFSKNYQDRTMSHVLDSSFETAVLQSDKADLNQIFSDIMLQAMTVAPISNDCAVVEIAKKNAELMESQNNKPVMRYMKMQLESIFLTKLAGEKLQKYMESLDQNVSKIHLPCANLDCSEVVLVNKFIDLIDLTSSTSSLYCGKCHV